MRHDLDQFRLVLLNRACGTRRHGEKLVSSYASGKCELRSGIMADLASSLPGHPSIGAYGAGELGRP
jgi:hypothetical protein